MIFLELTGAVDATGAEQTFYFASGAFTTTPNDSPPDTEFADRLSDPAALTFSIFANGGDSLFGGGAKLELGEIIAVNKDGEYDKLKDYSFDGRPFVMRYGEPGDGPYPWAFTPILSGTVAYITVTWAQLIITIRDATYIFDKPVLSRRFLGNNLLPNGIEGSPDDVGGQIVPRVYGKVLSIAPPCVNTSQLIYRVSDKPVDDIPAVYVRGGSQTYAGDVASSATLLNTSVAFGSYKTCKAEGLFKLGGADGLVTADVTEGSGVRNAAQLLKRLALQAGVPLANISLEDVDALEAKNAGDLGFWLADETTFTDAMDKVARSVGAWYAFDPLGKLHMGRLDGPTGTAAVTLEEFQVLTDGMERNTLTDLPVPVWSVTVNYARIGQTQTSDLVGTVTAARRAFLAQEFRKSVATNASVQAQFLLAESLTIDSLIVDQSWATAEAYRVLQLRDQPQDYFDVPLPASEAQAVFAKGVWLGSEIGLRLADSGRFDLKNGKTFILLGLKYERKAQRITFQLWGHGADIVVGPQIVEAFGIASAASFAMGVGQTASGPVPAVGQASASSSALGVGDVVGGINTKPAGQATGLLLAILSSQPTDTTGAGTARGTSTATGVSAATVAAAGTATATSSAVGAGRVAGSAGAGSPSGLLLAILRAS